MTQRKKAARRVRRVPSSINAQWHKQHPMPMGSTLSQRVEWHVAHARACGCRTMPPTILKELKRRGKNPPKRAAR
jgi:hypothetical protein